MAIVSLVVELKLFKELPSVRNPIQKCLFQFFPPRGVQPLAQTKHVPGFDDVVISADVTKTQGEVVARSAQSRVLIGRDGDHVTGWWESAVGGVFGRSGERAHIDVVLVVKAKLKISQDRNFLR